MKKFLSVVIGACIGLTACASPATVTTQTPDNPLNSLLGGATKKSDSGSKSGSGLGDALGGLLSGLLSTDKITPDKMVGNWKYTSPAVCFQSENFLQKAGGSAVAGTIEGKIAPYYKTAGLDKLTLVVNEDKTFTMASGAMKMSGTIEADGSGDVYFHFAAFGKIKLGKMKAYVVMSGNTMSLMFDVSKLVAIVKGVGSVTGSSTVNAVTGILDSYDGICAGFKLQKQ